MGCGASSGKPKKGSDDRKTEPAQSYTDESGAEGLITKEEQDAEAAKIKIQQSKSRRAGVAAESIDNDAVKDYKKPVHPKDDTTVQKIRHILNENKNLQVLFGHLEGEALLDVINAFYIKEIVEGVDIIRQGDQGDCLYIVNAGVVEIFVQRGKITPGEKGAKVLTLSSGGLFGELALMYHAPRAATVTAASEKVSCFVLDALDFKMLLAQSSQAQYAKYEGWLSEVDLLKSLNQYELSKLADAMQTERYGPGTEIIKQGESGNRFFIMEEGSAAAYMTGDEGEMEVKTYSVVGDYFGEVALLAAEPRQATVRSGPIGCVVVSLSKEHFDLLLGPISDILKKERDKYPKYVDFLRSAASKERAVTVTAPAKRVLIVVTSANKLGEKETGLWSEECCGPYFIFKDNGCEVTVCSIAGGDVPIDPSSLEDKFKTENDKRMEVEGWAPLKGTPKLADQDVDKFDILFFSGGHGTCVDFDSEEVAAFIGKAVQTEKVVAAVCHGPTALVKAVISGADGPVPLVKGKKVVCFTDVEEEQVGLTTAVPYSLESKMRELGAIVDVGDPWTDKAVRDGNLVTGQNPQSSLSCARLCLA